MAVIYVICWNSSFVNYFDTYHGGENYDGWMDTSSKVTPGEFPKTHISLLRHPHGKLLLYSCLSQLQSGRPFVYTAGGNS